MKNVHFSLAELKVGTNKKQLNAAQGRVKWRFHCPSGSSPKVTITQTNLFARMSFCWIANEAFSIYFFSFLALTIIKNGKRVHAKHLLVSKCIGISTVKILGVATSGVVGLLIKLDEYAWKICVKCIVTSVEWSNYCYNHLSST